MWRALTARLLRAAGLCLFLGAGFANAQEQLQPEAPGAGPYTHPASRLVFPDSLGGMPRLGVRDYEAMSPGLGVGVKYGLDSPKIFSDVYVFNAGRATIPEGAGDPLVQSMFEQAIGDIRSMADSGRYQNASFIGSDSIPLGEAAGARRVLRARFAFTLDGAEVYSHIYALAVHNHFVKLRFTYQRDQSAQAQPVLGAMLQDLGRVVGSNLQ